MIAREALASYLARLFQGSVEPRWYPTLSDATRQVLLDFARAMARAECFDPARVQHLLGGAT